ncbi:MAG: methionine--tRNA ligase subunit beta [Planctomycetota bacterium]
MISMDDFKKVDMKVGRIESAEDHPDADNLLVLQADVGEEDPRTLVAGLVGHYGKDELEGKQVVVVTNLEPARLRGIESEGMVLAAQDDDENVVLLTLDKEMEPGSPVL